MRSIAICDDNLHDLNHLYQLTENFLQRCGLDLTIETYSNGTALLNALTATPEKYILILIDILLGEANGVTIAKYLREQSIRSRLVLVSISPDFALEGYKVRADDYLIKPLTSDLFNLTLDRIFSMNAIINIKTPMGTHVLQTSEIYYIESDGHYVNVMTKTECLRSRRTLSDLIQCLETDGFARCQKGFVVNIAHVSGLLDNDLVLNNGKIIPVGRQYYDKIRLRLAEYAAFRLPSLL